MTEHSTIVDLLAALAGCLFLVLQLVQHAVTRRQLQSTERKLVRSVESLRPAPPKLEGLPPELDLQLQRHELTHAPRVTCECGHDASHHREHQSVDPAGITVTWCDLAGCGCTRFKPQL